MTQTPLRSPLNPEELAAIFGADDELALDVAAPDVSPLPPPNRRPVSLTGRIRNLPKWVLFIAGLVIGWLVIGWWVWPVHWSNSDPWDMSAKNQKTFVQVVADRYWINRDLAQAEATLGSWNRDDVNSLLVALQAETIEVEARQHLEALSQALNLPGGEQSLLTSIFNQDGIVIALAIAILPMFLAVGLVVASRLRATSTDEAGEAAAADGEAELEELLADVQLDAGQAGGQPPDQAAAPGEQPPEQTEATGEEEEEEAPDPNNPLGDLTSLFAEEDTSVALLEGLCKDMPDVDIDDLMKTSREMLRRFREEELKP